ncbi:sensor histidine kinase [Salinicola halimionae]|uniref:sensor histidine kinase n=1 Tax=Salinicola halimionae TaxID=1949081 RepID=UPI000DA171C8|nr:sensor histidine kinase [Salinicola halimionae]
MKPTSSLWLNAPIRRSVGLWLWWIWLLMPPTALALDSDLSLQQLHHRSWSGTAEEGGPGQVGAIAQTSDGYLWLGTHYSLFRFDGNTFERYVSLEGNTVTTVSSLLAIPDAGLWVGLRRGGISLIRDGGLTEYTPGAEFPSGAVYGLAQDHDGNVWAAANDGLARFDGNRWQLVSADWGFPGNNARAVFVDRDGTLWAASENHLFYLPRGNHRFITVDQPVGWISQMTQTRDGTLWVAELYPGRVRPILPDGKTSPSIDVVSLGLAADRDGNLWIGTQGDGLLRLPANGRVLSTSSDSLGDALQHYVHLDGLSADDVEPVFEDDAGNVWIGTSAGLDRFRIATLTPAKLPDGTRNIALAAEASGTLWAGSSNRPVMRQSAGNWQTTDVPPPITSAFSDTGGDVWLGGPNGLWRTHQGVLNHLTALPPAAQAEASVRAMARDGSGVLWVSINRLGLFRWHDGIWQPTRPPTSRPSQTMPISAASDAQGRVWFGYRDDLLVRRDEDGVRQWGEPEGLNIGNVTALAPSSQSLWVAGTNGVALFDGERFHAVARGAPFTGIHAIIETRSESASEHRTNLPPLASSVPGDLWLHTQSGILRIPAAEIAQVLDDPGYRVRFGRFDGDDDLPNDAFRIHPVPSAIRGQNGRLWFATVTGVVSIDPSRSQDRSPPPEPRITAVSADANTYSSASRISLSSRPRRIAIDYTAIDLARPDSVHFRYRLNGYDAQWHEVGNRRQAIYTRLGPGDYRFDVDAASSSGVWYPHSASVALHVAPAFYQTWIFRGLCLLTIITALWALYRYRMRQAAFYLRARLEARHTERDRIARELHDTLLQSIQALVLHFQAAADRMPTEDPARQAMTRALDRADEVIDEGRERVMSLRRASASDSLAARLSRVPLEWPSTHGVTCQVITQGTLRRLHSQVDNEVYWIGHEALCNALHHAAAAQITATLSYEKDGLRLSISDDGTGIPSHYLTSSGRPEHWGLPGMQERARQLRGRLTIDSQAGVGTTVRLSVPAAEAYRRQTRSRRRWRLGRT